MRLMIHVTDFHNSKFKIHFNEFLLIIDKTGFNLAPLSICIDLILLICVFQITYNCNRNSRLKLHVLITGALKDYELVNHTLTAYSAYVTCEIKFLKCLS